MDGAVDAVVAGHLSLDVIPDLSAATQQQVAALCQPGNLSKVGPVVLATGGAVSNTGLSLHLLGVRTRLMGKLGNDLFGKAILQIVGARGSELCAGLVVDDEVSSSYTVIISPPGVDRFFLHYPGANDEFGADDVDYEAVRDARLFHFGYPPLMRRMHDAGGGQLIEMFRRVKSMGVTTSLDMAIPDASSPAGRVDWAAIIKGVMPFVDVFLPSVEESLLMLWPDSYDSLVRRAGGPAILDLVTPTLLSELGLVMLDIGAKVVGFKLGHRGLYVRTADRAAIAGIGAARLPDADAWADKEVWAPVFEVSVVGTTGAGDATIAGFLAAMLRGLSLADAVTAAVAVGACNVEAADALGGIRSWDDTWHRVRAGWPRARLDLDAPLWRHDQVYGHWVGPAA